MLRSARQQGIRIAGCTAVRVRRDSSRATILTNGVLDIKIHSLPVHVEAVVGEAGARFRSDFCIALHQVTVGCFAPHITH